MIKFGVYAFIFQTKHGPKQYIGSTTRSFEVRRKEHFHLLKCGRHENAYLQSLWNKYGIPDFSILEICNDPEKIAFCEQKWIDRTDPTQLINLGPAIPSPMFGRHMSIKARQKISQWAKERVNTPEGRQGMALLRKGKHHSAETREKMSLSHKGQSRHQSIETREKLSKYHLGKIHSKETLQKMSRGHIGHLASSETREKRSQTMKKIWAKKKLWSEVT